MMTSRAWLLTVVIAAGFCGSIFAGSADGVDNEVGQKKPFEFRRGDAVLTLGGKTVNEYRFAKNAVMLNNDIPDETGHFRTTLDTSMNLAYGEKKFGHKAVEMGSTLRFKTIWGKIGHQSKTDENDEFKIGNAAVGAHTHTNRRSLVWIKDAWLQASLNAIFGMNSDKVHTIKVGMFPFLLGRGITLGPIYGLGKSFLAIYNRDTDYSPTGILFSGEILKDKLWYDLYYAKFEDKSASFGDVFNSRKEMIIGRRATPWSGPAKDSDIVAARLRIKPFDDNKGKLEIEPYIFYNEDSDEKLELPLDSKNILGAVGASVEYSKSNFECGGEAAFNYGHELVYNIDRNIVQLKMIKYSTDPGFGSVREVYSKVKINDGSSDDGELAPVNATTKDAVQKNTNYTNGAALSSNANYRSDTNRFRPAYKNKYCGWMAVLDASYLFDCIDLKLSGAYGYASGDKNPHVDEVNKNYKGFVGLYELYAGKRVPSVFVLDARKIKRPLTMIENAAGEVDETGTDSDSSFTDLQYVGLGVSWEPESLEKNNFKLNPNVLFFWKNHRSRKYDRALDGGSGAISTTEYASKFLGTEFNLIAQYDLLKDLSLKGAFAFFFPGGYYKDIKGAPMKGDLFNKLEVADKASLDSSKYRIGDDSAFYGQIVLEYKF
jgi:hypothetical protein